MKVGIITIHYGVNYGSALQAYALTKFLNDKGYEAEIINYIPERYRVLPYFATTKNSLIINTLYIIIRFPFLFLQRKVFSDFIKENIPISKLYKTKDELYNTSNKYDVYITGSDQVWNIDYNGDTQELYYLSFAPKNSIKIACSASFGKASITDKKDIEIIGKTLKDFKAISVREDTGLKILCEAGISNALHTVDPIFLYNKDMWMEQFGFQNLILQPYILIYALDNEEDRLIKYAHRIATTKGYKVALISFDNRRRNKKNVDYCFYNKSPEYFINLFSNAEYIVTNSFHGVAFSINFEKQFIAVSRKAYNTRIESILKMFNLKSRLIERNKDLELDIALREINYSNIHFKIEEQREKLKKFLLDNLAYD